MIPLFPLPFLAEVAATAAPHTSPPDQMLSGNWLLYAFGIVVSVCVGAWLRISGKKAGIEQATNNVTLQHPVPDLSVREIKSVTWDRHSSLEKRVEAVERDQREMRKEAGERYVKLLETGQEREHRLSEQIDKVAREWHGRMDLQFGPQPRAPRKS